MAAPSSGHRTAGVPQYDEYGKPITRGAAHWVVFAGVMLILVGFFHAVEGLAALFQDHAYAVRPSGLLVIADYTVWGWVHLLLGAVALLTGAGLLAGNLVARVVGVGLAGVSAIVSLAFIPASPAGATLLIVFDVVIIYAIVVHGGELKRRSR